MAVPCRNRIGELDGKVNAKEEEVRKVLYISERIVNISELEKQIQNAKLYFDILKKELKNTAPSETIDGAVYQIDQSLKAAVEFDFLLEQRKCEITNFSEYPKE